MMLAKLKILLLLFLLLPGLAFAFRIDTPLIKAELSDGETHGGTVLVENPSRQELSLKVYLEDFLYKAPFEGDKEFFAPGTTAFSLSDHLSVSPREVTIPPYGQARINFTITAPDKFEQTLCGVLFFETSIAQGQDQAGRGLNILGRIGSLVFINPQDLSKQAVFSDIWGGTRAIEGLVANSGNTFFRDRLTFYVIDEEGMVYDRGQLADFFLLPGDKKELAIPLADSLLAGTYTIVITSDLGDRDLLVKEIDFSLSASGQVSIIEIRD